MISDKGTSIKFLLFVLISIFVSGNDAEVRCIEREREALLSFKNSLIGDDGILSSWQSDECCEWYGVVCSNTTRHVIIALKLNACDYDGALQGKVGSSLLELHHLKYLDLSCNDFGGNSIPEFIGSMKQLKHLFLRHSNFSGIIPPQIGNLTNLHSLNLSRNDFGGSSIPEFICSMKQLQHLNLWDSNFSGIVPPQIGNLTNLRSLDLSHNSLTTENLDWLPSLSLLSFLDLSQIDLSHSNWLHHISNLHSLYELHLKYCSLKDNKPSYNSSSTSLLSILDLSGNQLTSYSLHWLSNINKSLVEIKLSNNALGGPIPNALIESLVLIEYLDLSSNMLQGQIPKSLSNLSRLRVLVLYENELRGHFEELFGNISAKGILESLQILDLADNKLSGSVPDLRAFSALTEVYLEGNNFTGSMPLSIGQLSKLEILDLSSNSLEGSISESHFIKLDKLKILDLSYNSLILHTAPDWSPTFQLDIILLAGCNVGPSFPKWIHTQRNLSTLDLSRGGIRDEAPTWLWTISPSFEALNLSYNQITGFVPNLSSTFHYIDLSNNNFSGPIPLFFANAKLVQLNGNIFSGSISSVCEIPHYRLEFLDLSNNKLAGEVPNCWEKMPYLFSLNLADNSFSGEIPRSFGSLIHLAALQLRDNNLSGELPSSLRLCQKLELVDVGGNELTGEIPTWIGQLYKKIHFLNLRGNQLHGNIPSQICNLTRIRILDLSMNYLSGIIPDCFNSFADMAYNNATQVDASSRFGYYYWFKYNKNLPNENTRYVDEYSSFQWKGHEFEYWKNLLHLKLIDFSSNRLTGNIPQSFSGMRELICLNLSRNSLTGNIIPNIGEMEMLECLDLSQNHLSGKIPTSLARLNFLAFLNLSSNGLSGKIPMSTQLQSFNASAYADNDGLCGSPLASCPEDSLRPSTTNPSENMNEKDGSNLSFMQEVCISMAFGLIFGFWGVVGSFILKKSWRIAYFNFWDDVGDWIYVRVAVFLSKWRRS